MANGPIPNGLWVLHKCDNPACVRVDHLFLGTPTDNVRDCVAKQRHVPPAGAAHWAHKDPTRVRGERNGYAKLTLEKVRDIRARLAAGERRSLIAAAFNVGKATIGSIARGENWGSSA